MCQRQVCNCAVGARARMRTHLHTVAGADDLVERRRLLQSVLVSLHEVVIREAVEDVRIADHSVSMCEADTRKCISAM